MGPHLPETLALVSRILYENDCSIGDSLMMAVEGEFAVMLVISAPKGMKRKAVLDEFKKSEIPGIKAHLKEIGKETPALNPLSNCVITLHGRNRRDIIYRTALALSCMGVDVMELETRLVRDNGGDLYVMVIEALKPEGLAIKELKDKLRALSKELRLKISVRPIDPYDPVL